MPLAPGTRLGPYEIVGSLGAGGPLPLALAAAARATARLAEAQQRPGLW